MLFVLHFKSILLPQLHEIAQSANLLLCFLPTSIESRYLFHSTDTGRTHPFPLLLILIKFCATSHFSWPTFVHSFPIYQWNFIGHRLGGVVPIGEGLHRTPIICWWTWSEENELCWMAEFSRKEIPAPLLTSPLFCLPLQPSGPSSKNTFHSFIPVLQQKLGEEEEHEQQQQREWRREREEQNEKTSPGKSIGPNHLPLPCPSSSTSLFSTSLNSRLHTFASSSPDFT